MVGFIVFKMVLVSDNSWTTASSPNPWSLVVSSNPGGTVNPVSILEIDPLSDSTPLGFLVLVPFPSLWGLASLSTCLSLAVFLWSSPLGSPFLWGQSFRECPTAEHPKHLPLLGSKATCSNRQPSPLLHPFSVIQNLQGFLVECSGFVSLCCSIPGGTNKAAAFTCPTWVFPWLRDNSSASASNVPQKPKWCWHGVDSPNQFCWWTMFNRYEICGDLAHSTPPPFVRIPVRTNASGSTIPSSKDLRTCLLHVCTHSRISGALVPNLLSVRLCNNVNLSWDPPGWTQRWA